MKKIVIKNKIRFTLFLASIFMMGYLCCLSCFNISPAYSKNNAEYISYVVDRGDTLWNIAQKNNIHNDDIRKVVRDIKYYNNIESEIYVGQIIKIPT